MLIGQLHPSTISALYDAHRDHFLDELYAHQRMDFLMLPSQNERVVLEVDGKQHYADGDMASPTKYAVMVEADRDMSLRGYDVYRFGGAETNSPAKAAALAQVFFPRLFNKYCRE